VATDRKRLKTIVQDLDVPQGMGLIVRTAGAKRTKAELKRDYEYLMRMWENIREKTMHSVAPALIYEEEDLVKRAIRDMFDKDLEGIWVEGEAGYREARDFMRMIMPSQAKKIIPYRDPTPLFVQAKVEEVLAQIYSPVVPLKSGGYLVINQTEALVAVDVNSGKSTRERNIEATALKTNLEAAAEAARQLRLRDLAGLIVIDFIDMDEAKNNRAVEKVLKDSLKDDRARIQMGKISSFGLMEISRQRRRTGVLEGTTHVCEHCNGTGRVRSPESASLSALRAVEMEAVRGGGGAVTLHVSRAVGLYILNEKRGYLERVRQGHGLHVTVLIDETIAQAEHRIERTETREHDRSTAEAQAALAGAYPADTTEDFVADVEDDEDDEDEVIEGEVLSDDDDDEDEDDHPVRARASEGESEGADDQEGGGRNKRRRRRRGRRGDEPQDRAAQPAVQAAESPAAIHGDDEDGEDGVDSQGRKRRRRGRRGGRRMREDVRKDDPYAWTRPRVPEGDPYIWMDIGQPVIAVAPAQPVAIPARIIETSANTAEAIAWSEPPAVTAANDETVDVWVELPAETAPADKPARSRRSRSKPRPAAQTVETTDAVETVQAETSIVEAPVAEAPAEAVHAEPVQAEAAPVVIEPAPEPAPVKAKRTRAAVASVVTPEAPDVAEILSPPAKPKSGWWRRNG
jgi:ribonuclease E